MALFLAAILVIFALWTNKFRLDGMLFSILFLSLVSIGYAVLDETYNANIWPIYFFSLLTFWLGYVSREKGPGAKPLSLNLNQFRCVYLTAAIVFFLAAYHVVAIGLPLLSLDVEVQRFEFSGSGLFGLPSRMWLFGMPAVMFGIWYLMELYPSAYTRFWGRFYTGLFILISLMGGFKGTVGYIIVHYLTFRLLIGRELSINHKSIRNALFLGVAVIAFLQFSMSKYGSLADASTLSYLFERVTTIPAKSGYTLYYYDVGVERGFWGLWKDFSYFLQKYVGSDVSEIRPIEYFAFTTMWNINPFYDDSFSPIAVGFPGQTYYFFGWGGSLVLCGALGFVLRGFVRNARSARSPQTFLWFGMIVTGLRVLFINGNIAYVLINYSVTLVILLGLKIFFDWILQISIQARY